MSNLYASRVSTEHPIVTWPMDDGASFIALNDPWDTLENTISSSRLVAESSEIGISRTQKEWADAQPDTSVVRGNLPELSNSPIKTVVPDILPLPADQTDTVLAGDTITIGIGYFYSSDEVVSGVPITASAYIFFEDAWASSVDIGSHGFSAMDADSSVNYTRNIIDSSVSNQWVKVQTSAVSASDDSVFIRFNLIEGQTLADIKFHVNGLVVGQRSEEHSSASLGVRPHKIGPYIKGRGVDITSTDYPAVASEIFSSEANAITVPVKCVMATTSSDSVYIDDDSLAFAKKIYNNFSENKKIIIEPWPWIGSGYGGPDNTDADHPSNVLPANPTDWFASWQKALTILAAEMPEAWGIYVGSNLTALEDETDLWIDLMDAIRKDFRGKIMYKTEWWIWEGSVKAALGLWAGVDIAAVSAFFELTEQSAPSQGTLESAIVSTTAHSRGQNVRDEVLAIYDTWGVPVLLGDLTCPDLNAGAFHPWDALTGYTANSNIQARLLGAYQNVFGDSDGYLGFSVPYADSAIDYGLSDSAVDYLEWLQTAPVDNHDIRLAPAKPEVNEYVGTATITSNTNFSLDSHNLRDGDVVTFVDIGVSNLSGGTEYIVMNSAPDSFNVHQMTSGLQLYGLNNVQVKVYVKRYSAFYVAKDNVLASRSTGIPMAFGSRSYTRLEPAGSSSPSFVIDGHGAFNKYGLGHPITIEFWMRIAGAHPENIKIFGPVDHQDGLYVNGSTFTIVAGGAQSSCNVGIASDPMLVHIRLYESRVDLMINGETLASANFEQSNVTWTQAHNTMLGFYSHEYLAPIDIDCVSLFSYHVPDVVAKRRFAWGQAVETADIVSDIYGGQAVQSSFAESNAANSVSYPDTYSWGSGQYSNLDVKSDRISMIERPLPDVVTPDESKEIYVGNANIDVSENLFTVPSHGLSNGDIIVFSNLVTSTGITADGEARYYVVNKTQSTFQVSGNRDSSVTALAGSDGTVDVTKESSTLLYDELELYSDNKKIQGDESFFSLVPNTDWSGKVSYFSFNSMQEYSDKSRGFAVTYAATSLSGSEPILLIRSKQDNSIYVKVHRVADEVKADFFNNGVSTEVLSTTIVADNRYTFLTDFMSSAGATASIPLDMKYMFGAMDDIECVVGSDTVTSFSGKIYRVSFFNHDTFANLSDFTSGYCVEMIDYDGLNEVNMDAIDRATYSMYAQNEYNDLYPEISQLAYWEDYVPMSTLAGVVNGYSGEKKAFVDQLQFNIGFPKPSATDSVMPIYALFEALYGVTALRYGDFSTIYPAMTYGVQYSDFFAEYGFTEGVDSYIDLEALYGSMTYNEFAAYASDPDSFTPYSVDDMEVRSFLAIQRSNGLVRALRNIDQAMPATRADIVYMDAWGIDTGDRMEVVNGTTIIPIKTLSLEKLMLSVHLQIYSKATVKRPVSVKSLEIASYAHNKDSSTDIGSKFGHPVYPFIDNGIYYDFTGTNPYRLNKRGMPPLYLGRETGFVPVGLQYNNLDRGLAMVVKEAANVGSDYSVRSLQFWVRREKSFSTSPQKMYELEDLTTKISLYVVPVSGDEDRAIVYALDESGNPYTALSYYQNGNYVAYPVLSKEEWTSIAVELDAALPLESSTPLVKIYPGFIYSNVSYYPSYGVATATRAVREWREVNNAIDWTYWTTGSSFESGISSWYGVLYPGSVISKLESVSRQVYDSFIGQDETDLSAEAGVAVAQDLLQSTGDYSVITQRHTPV